MNEENNPIFGLKNLAESIKELVKEVKSTDPIYQEYEAIHKLILKAVEKTKSEFDKSHMETFDLVALSLRISELAHIDKSMLDMMAANPMSRKI